VGPMSPALAFAMLRAIILLASQDSIWASLAVDRSCRKASAVERSTCCGRWVAARTIQVMKSDEDTLRAIYTAFNARDIEAG